MQSWQNKLRAFVKTDAFTCLAIAVIWQLFMTIVGFIVDRQTNPAANPLNHLIHWDAGWYMTVINDWYNSNLASAAFYPLYPLVVWVTSGFGVIDFAFSALLSLT